MIHSIPSLRACLRASLLGCALLLATACAGRARADVYMDVSSIVTNHQTGGPFITFDYATGNNLWRTPESFTNTSGTGLMQVYWVTTQAWVYDPGINGLAAMTWDNAAQEWTYNSATLPNVIAKAANATLSLPLSRSVTNIPIPSGFGLSTSSSLSAFPVGDLGAGQTASAELNYEVSPSVTGFGFSGSKVAACSGPTISNVSTSPNTLWPPNHKMVLVTVNYTLTDDCGPASATLSVSSNEPVNGIGDGNTSPDWQVVDAHHVYLRAERSGPGDGRVYTITVNATDALGFTASATTTVTVPHNR